MTKFLIIAFLLIANPALAADPTTNGSTTTIDPAKLQAQEARVKKIFNAFIAELKKNPLEYTISVENSSVLNAHASLGKKIVVNSALIDYLNDPALAFVIAHELGHVEGHHVMKSIARQGFFAIIKQQFFPTSTVYDSASFVGNMGFSRGSEKKADLFAVKIMNKLYCNQPGKLEFFKKMSANGAPPKILEYFTTHPFPATRIEYLEEHILEAKCLP